MNMKELFDEDDIICSVVEGNLAYIQHVLEAIVNSQGDVSVVDRILDGNGNTPLLMAYKNNHPAIVDELLLFGCSPDIQNLRGENLRSLFLQHTGADYMKLVINSYFVVCEKKEVAQVQFGVLLDEFSKEYLGRKVFNLSRYISSCELEGIRGSVHQTALHIYEDAYGAVKFLDNVFSLLPWESRDEFQKSPKREKVIISSTVDLSLPATVIEYSGNQAPYPRCTQSLYKLYCIEVDDLEKLVGRMIMSGEVPTGICYFSSIEASELMSVEYLNQMKKILCGHELENI